MKTTLPVRMSVRDSAELEVGDCKVEVKISHYYLICISLTHIR